MMADRHKRKQYHNPSTEDSYAAFHHGESQQSRTVDVPEPPTDAYVIGRLVELQYLPYKSSKKHHERYSHQFGDTGYSKDGDPDHMPLLLADSEGNLFISRDHSRYTINGRGIVG